MGEWRWSLQRSHKLSLHNNGFLSMFDRDREKSELSLGGSREGDSQ